jgi:hypothetical protein
VGSGFKSRGVHGKSSYFSRELDFLKFGPFGTTALTENTYSTRFDANYNFFASLPKFQKYLKKIVGFSSLFGLEMSPLRTEQLDDTG